MRTEWGVAIVIRNGGSKNSTSPPYLVKNERSLSVLYLIAGYNLTVALTRGIGDERFEPVTT